jgi:hypothetical protein
MAWPIRPFIIKHHMEDELIQPLSGMEEDHSDAFPELPEEGEEDPDLNSKP